jgi:DNA-binding NtrC family response regulator
VARLLLAEDDGPTREAMAEILAVYGHEVTTAETAWQACSLLDGVGCGFEIVVTDVRLPGGSFLILEHARSRRPEVPVIMMTGRSDASLCDRALRQGALALLRKPVAGRDLHRLVLAALVPHVEGEKEACGEPGLRTRREGRRAAGPRPDETVRRGSKPGAIRGVERKRLIP